MVEPVAVPVPVKGKKGKNGLSLDSSGNSFDITHISNANRAKLIEKFLKEREHGEVVSQIQMFESVNKQKVCAHVIETFIERGDTLNATLVVEQMQFDGLRGQLEKRVNSLKIMRD